MSYAPLPPGPHATVLNQELFFFLKDPSRFLSQTSNTYGDIVHLRIGRREIFFLNHPSYFLNILEDKKNDFKNCTSLRFKKAFWGSILQPDKEILQRDREKTIELLQKNIESNFSQRFIQKDLFKNRESGSEINLYDEILAEVLPEIIQKILGERSKENAERLKHCFLQLLIQEAYSAYPIIQNSPLNLSRKKNRQEILSVLSESGVSNQNAQILLEAVLFSAKAVSGLITNTIGFMDQLPQNESILRQGLSENQNYTCEYGKVLLQETARLTPPIEAVACRNHQDWLISGYIIPKNSTILLSQWILQHDARFFYNPNAFLPERWQSEESLKKQVLYLPFGTGSTQWLGDNLILPLAEVLLTKIIQEWWIRKDSNNAPSKHFFRIFKISK